MWFSKPNGNEQRTIHTLYRAVVEVYARREEYSGESAPWALLVSSAAYCADKSTLFPILCRLEA